MDAPEVNAEIPVDRRLEAFARTEAGDLYSLFRRCLGNAEEAADLVQETLLYAWKNLALYDRERPFRAWIFRIGQNRLRTFLKRRRLHRAFEQEAERRGPPASVEPAQSATIVDERRRLDQAIAALPERQRIAVILRYQQGLSCREIGEILEMSENAVSIQLHHARREMRQSIGEAESGGRP